ncbi:TipAS antibiotic-recognition domain-containing protein [Paenibacillus sp. JX-17]|uniref:TipAS antibiotic-recognition domain-containing protein n=1 Tax=Paenibacillus lacisoli TaxID=3064525 RepID=A0ABT9CG64_9BACL|nr:TipAS antibiotic-recognition domain-containing protein [Paenibacillus sp. JX-17]MDO7908283.1 TipAS antibiotic-recognition domain-containing protein [Paenibacillus sp. JX-17]
MAYSMEDLSQLSGLSKPALSFYEEIGLLKTGYGEEHHEAVQTANRLDGEKPYGEEELQRLQHIMFYRECGYPLSDLDFLVQQNQNRIVNDMIQFRQKLLKQASRLYTLAQTIDKTVASCQGKHKMDPEEWFAGFDPGLLEQNAPALAYNEADPGTDTEFQLPSKEQYLDSQAELDIIIRKLASLLKEGLQPQAEKVQELVREHLDWVRQFYVPTAEIYKGLGELYVEQDSFRKLYDSYCPGLAEYLRDAMKVLAERELQ